MIYAPFIIIGFIVLVLGAVRLYDLREQIRTDKRDAMYHKVWKEDDYEADE